jgi:hypothetical protein
MPAEDRDIANDIRERITDVLKGGRLKDRSHRLRAAWLALQGFPVIDDEVGWLWERAEAITAAFQPLLAQVDARGVAADHHDTWVAYAQTLTGVFGEPKIASVPFTTRLRGMVKRKRRWRVDVVHEVLTLAEVHMWLPSENIGEPIAYMRKIVSKARRKRQRAERLRIEARRKRPLAVAGK